MLVLAFSPIIDCLRDAWNSNGVGFVGNWATRRRQRRCHKTTANTNNHLVAVDNEEITALMAAKSPPDPEEQTASSKQVTRKDFFTEEAILGPPMETKPDYESIVGPLGKFCDTIFLSIFRMQLAEKTGVDSSRPVTDYLGIIEIALKMNSKFPDRAVVQNKAKDVLVALFPSWMPPSYAELFSKPFPAFSSRMNAWATMVAGTWLMGECEINDVEAVDDGSVGRSQGLYVKRCRFLEESGCASVCVNSCKIPTQRFFMEEMGLPLTMEPNYETFECQFSFGLTPDPDTTEILAKSTPCLSRCPTAGALRKYHDEKGSNGGNNSPSIRSGDIGKPCQLMDDAINGDVVATQQDMSR